MIKNDGFTLLEVLIAITILGISLTVLVQGFIQINLGLERNDNYTYLSSWATSTLNEIIQGVELRRNGFFSYQERRYNWQLEEEYKMDRDLVELRLKIEWQGKRAKQSYSISRLVDSNEWE